MRNPYSRIWRPLAAALACGSWAFTGGLACHGGPHVGPHTLTACWRKPYRGCRGRRSSRGRDQLAQGQRGRGACPHPKVFKEPGTRAPWVRPTTPPAAPSGQRAADVGRYGESSRAGPSVIGRPVRRLPPSRGALATWTGGQRGGTPAPRPDRAPPPKKGTRYTLKDSIGLNPHPETLRDYRSKPTIIQLVNHIRT